MNTLPSLQMCSFDFEALLDGFYDDEIEEDYIAEKEWKRTENDMRKIGFRTGLRAVEDEALQQGFDAASVETAKMGFAVGRLQGQISGGLIMLESMGAKGDMMREADQLKAQLKALLDACAHFQQSILSLQDSDMPPSPLNCPQPTCPTGQTDPKGLALMPQPPSGTDEDLREVTDHFMAMDEQDLPLSPVADFSKKLEIAEALCQKLIDRVFKFSCS